MREIEPLGFNVDERSATKPADRQTQSSEIHKRVRALLNDIAKETGVTITRIDAGWLREDCVVGPSKNVVVDIEVISSMSGPDK